MSWSRSRIQDWEESPWFSGVFPSFADLKTKIPRRRRKGKEQGEYLELTLLEYEFRETPYRSE